MPAGTAGASPEAHAVKKMLVEGHELFSNARGALEIFAEITRKLRGLGETYESCCMR